MTNVGQVDRILRLVAGVVLLALPFVLAGETGPVSALGGFGWLSMVAGAVMLLTGAMRFCPIYRIFGLRTCPITKKTML
ncbi:DUF2892 domain-containing protein [Thalassospira alkalitolerans]|uniref:YgaP family membrane protein n=1 Tax=Thalassospira alkalitolerans TaxID=1293890 RepID=UPI0030ED385E|tara:strand:- start:81069 stop:81305 length:237 start_codon:yes stop_codon:yes gene_type:complete